MFNFTGHLWLVFCHFLERRMFGNQLAKTTVIEPPQGEGDREVTALSDELLN